MPGVYYQQRCKDELAQYLRRVIAHGRADLAFYEQTGRAYRPVHALPGLPYVCVRVPTGGGKTVLAAHSVGIAARELLHQERCMALWLGELWEERSKGLCLFRMATKANMDHLIRKAAAKA